MSTLPLATVKSHLSACVDSVQLTRERVTITRNGVPAGVLISVDDLESLEETLSLLSDTAAMSQIKLAERELDAGLGEVLAEFRPRVAA